ncbi:hypothetical protein MMPV_005684 [Pyropia vietnamensis]
MVAYNPPATLADVHAYITGVTAAATQAPSTLRLHVTHANMTGTTFAELRLSRNDTPPTLRERLYRVTGTRPAAMGLSLVPPAGAVGPDAVATIPLTDDAAPLGAVAPAITDGWTIHVTDSDGSASASAGGRLAADAVPSDTERFVLSDDAYAARPNSVRAVKARMRAAEAAAAVAAGRDPPAEGAAWSATRAARDRRLVAAGGVDMEPITGVSVGDRVEVSPGGKRGVVAWVGDDVGGGVPPGWWVGVTYDEPVGRNDGSVGGVRLWTCEAGYGGLVRRRNVAVGDFPPRDDLAGDDLGDDEV